MKEWIISEVRSFFVSKINENSEGVIPINGVKVV